MSEQKVLTPRKRKDESTPLTTPTDYLRLKGRVSTTLARLDFARPPATSPRKQKRRPSPREDIKRVKSVIEPGNEKKVQFKNRRPAQSAWKQSQLSVSRGLTLSQMPPKRKKPRHDRLKNFDPETMLVEYERPRYPAYVDVSAFLKKTSSSHRVSGTPFWSLPSSRRYLSSALPLTTKSTGHVFSSQLRS